LRPTSHRWLKLNYRLKLNRLKLNRLKLNRLKLNRLKLNRLKLDRRLKINRISLRLPTFSLAFCSCSYSLGFLASASARASNTLLSLPIADSSSIFTII